MSLNKCQDCHPSCQSCYGPNSDNCLQCTNDYSLNIETHTCSKSCHRKFYKDRKTNICKPCHYSCTSCFGPDENQCLTCSDKLQFHNNTCVWQCPSGWYKTFGQQCSQCSPRCKKCLYKYDLCTHCHHDKVWHDFKCYNHCGSSMFNDSSNRCYKCHDSCHACHGTAPNECTSCKASMTLFNGMCLQGCLPGFYNSSITKHCEPCMEDCLKCVGKFMTYHLFQTWQHNQQHLLQTKQQTPVFNPYSKEGLVYWRTPSYLEPGIPNDVIHCWDF